MSDVTTEVKKPKERVGFGAKIKRAFRGYVSEFKKIVWPSRKQVVNNTIVTIVMVVVVGLFIWLLDFAFGWLLDLVLDLVA